MELSTRLFSFWSELHPNMQVYSCNYIWHWHWSIGSKLEYGNFGKDFRKCISSLIIDIAALISYIQMTALLATFGSFSDNLDFYLCYWNPFTPLRPILQILGDKDLDLKLKGFLILVVILVYLGILILVVILIYLGILILVVIFIYLGFLI